MLSKRSFRECVIERSEDLCATVLPFQTDQLWEAQDALAFIFYLPYDQSTNTLMIFSNWLWKGKVVKSFLCKNRQVSLSAALPSRFLTESRVSQYPCYWHFRPHDSSVVGWLVHGNTFRNISHLCLLSTDRSQLKTTPDTSKCLIRGQVISVWE